MRSLALIAALAILAGIWLVGLPYWASQPRMHQALERHSAAGLNGGATYYTENPAAISNLQAIQRLQQQQPHLFWKL